MSGVVDAHTHLLPERLARAIRAYFDRHHPSVFLYPLDHRTVLDRLAADGIDMVWTLPYAHKPGMAEQLNASMWEVAAEVADHPVDVVVGCTAHPGDDDPGGIVARAADGGAKVCKLHCSVGDYEPDDPRLNSVWSTAAERRMPVVLHAGHAVSGHTDEAELEPVSRVAERHPDCRIIIAHAGHRAERAALALLDRHPNVHIDLTPVISDLVPLSADDVVARGDRVLFGSDAPNTSITAGAAVAHVRQWQLPGEVEEMVLGGNARRLLGG